jgi:hypothetical protein
VEEISRMTMLTDPILHEVFNQWPAWQEIVSNVTVGADAKDADPLEVDAALDAMSAESIGRLVHLLIGHACANTIDEGLTILHEVWELAALGQRPRYGAEAGLTMGDFEEIRPHA